MGERVSNNHSTIDSESYTGSASITRLTVYGTLMVTYDHIQEEYMNNVASLVRVNHTRTAREVLEHAQTMP